MKKFLLKKSLAMFLTLVMVFALLPIAAFAENDEISNDAQGCDNCVGYPEYSNEVPADWENDLWLQYDHKELDVDDTADIFPRRVPQIIDDPINNNVTRPNFNFKIAEGNSVSLSANSGDRITVKAERPGVSVVKVTYDAVGEYGACSTVNTAYAVYTVGETGKVAPEIGKNLKNITSYDTLYYTDDYYPLTFTATADDAKTLKVTCNGNEITANDDGSYTANLENRSNIIGVVATDSEDGTKSYYKVVDARKIEIDIKNKTYPGFEPAVGDTVNVSFKGITMPIYKLGTIYNPCSTRNWGNKDHPEWDTVAAHVLYRNAEIDGEFKGYCSQYDLATNNDFDIELKKAGIFTFTSDGIAGNAYAKNIGDDKVSDSVGGVNVNNGDYPILKYNFSKLPDFTLEVNETTTAKKLEKISFGESEITLFKGEDLTEEQIIERLGGVTIKPVDATNREYTWSTSDVLKLNLHDGFYAQQLTDEEEPVTLTATTVDGSKTATCSVTIIERPATEQQKAALKSTIDEARKVTKTEGTDDTWDAFQEAIVEAVKVHDKGALTGKEADKAVGDLENAINKYNKVVSNLTEFKYSINQEKVEDGTKVTVNFPNMSTDLGSEDTTSLKLKYSTDIPNMPTVETEDCKDNKELLKTLSFMVSNNVNGEFSLSNGYIEEKYDYCDPELPPQFCRSSKINKLYKGDMPDITFTIENNSKVTPPIPEPEEKTATISIDKLTIGKGYVLESTEVTFSEGETVWDVTKRVLDDNDIECYYESSEGSQYNSVYVSSIAGDGEFDNGPGSGWMYCVNDVYPNKGVSLYTLEDGDVIRWRYTTNLGEDIKADGAWGGSDSDDDQNDDEEDSDTSGDNDSDDDSQNSESGKEIIIPNVTVSDSTANAEIKTSDVTEAIGAAKESKVDNVTIELENDDKTTAASVAIPSEAISEIVGKSDLKLKLTTPVGTLIIPNEVLDSIKSQMGKEKVLFNVTAKDDVSHDSRLDNVDLTNADIVEVTVTAGGKLISEFNGGKLTVSVPVGGHFKVGQNYEVIVLSSDGTIENLNGKVIEKDGIKVVDVTVPHLSTFIVTNSQHDNFTDVEAKAWYYDAVQYVANHGLMDGIGNSQFNPDGDTTRAMLVTILYRLEGSPEVAAKGNFTDVSDGQWYTDAVTWAETNKIVYGYGNGLFGVNNKVTRQEIAAIMYRYSQYKKYDVTKTNELNGYTDKDTISDWALPAMQWANAEDIISGRTTSTLTPVGTASRSEIASILMRFAENIAK